MKIERTKNAARNILFGGLLKLYQIVIPFLMRTAIIYFIGIEFLGINSLFSSILQVLNLAELGIGAAMVYSMYKPIAEEDSFTICALMKLYQKYYYLIGLLIAIAGICLLPVIPNLIKIDTIPDGVNIYYLYLLNLCGTVLSYWLFSYKNSLLIAHQRIDVNSKIVIYTNSLQYVIQLFVLVRFYNYYYYVIVMVMTQVFTNIIVAIIVNRMYPQYRAKGTLNKDKISEINRHVRDLFTAKLGSVVVGASDTVVISAFLGLTVLAVYQNYYYIMNAVCGIISVVFAAVIAGIGNSLVTESIDKNYSDFKQFTFIICWILCVSCCCLIGLYQPFMELWVGKDYLLSFDLVILFCVFFYIHELSMIWATVKDAAGLWHSDRFRPLIGASVNLILNLLMIHYIGLYGILLSTIISYLFVSMPWLIHNLFRFLYRRSMTEYIIFLIKHIGTTIAACLVSYIILNKVSGHGIKELFIKGIICFTISNTMLFFMFYQTREFKQTKKLIRNILKF